jgi:trimeric autotransporter adhesin
VTANVSGTVSMLLNDAHGRFRAGPSYRVGKSPASVTVSDLNGERKPDLIVADGMDRLVSVLLGAGHGRFLAAISYRLGPPPHPSNWFVPRVHVAIAIGDVNGDGKPDLVTATADTFQSRSSGVARVSRSVGVMRVLLGDGHGRFRAIAPYRMVDMYPAAAVLADLNGDGRFEVIVAAEPTAPLVSAVSVSCADTACRFPSPDLLSRRPRPNCGRRRQQRSQA